MGILPISERLKKIIIVSFLVALVSILVFINVSVHNL
jgi:hypothetical protein